MSAADSHKQEARAFHVSMWANLFMGSAGLFTAAISNSQAILLDGVFSFVGFFAAIFALQVRKRANNLPDKERPMGYAAEEAIFTTFRSLSLLFVVGFAIFGALSKIVGYYSGQEPEVIKMEPVIVYFFVICATCIALWSFHYTTWHRGGKESAMLKLEASAAAFDGAVTAAAGAGLIAIYLFRDGPLAPIAPIGDSLLVVCLCSMALGGYWKGFRNGLAELAGVTADPEHIAAARRGARQVLEKADGKLVDMAVTKVGRRFFVSVFFNPTVAISAAETDQMTVEMEKAVRKKLPGGEVYVIISEHGRAMPIAQDVV